MQVVAEDVQRQHARALGGFLAGRVAADVIDNFVAHAGRGGGGHRQRGRVAKRVARLLDKEIVGPEIVAPQADTVGFVHHKEGQPGAAQGGEKRALAQPFGRGIDELVIAAGDACQPRFDLLFGERAVDKGGLASGRGGQAVHLVFHQRDQRADDERGLGQDERGQLIAERFARAGGHDRQDRFVAQDGRHDLGLAFTQLGKTKVTGGF